MRIARCVGALLFVFLVATEGVGADDVGNDLDDSADANAEVISLAVGDAPVTTALYLMATDGDGRDGCNLVEGTSLVLDVVSSNPAVATISPASVTMQSCEERPLLTVEPVAPGEAFAFISQASNDTGATFNIATALFRVVVSAAGNNPPNVTVTVVSQGATYEIGSVPAAGCLVVDAEDGTVGVTAVLSPITGQWAAYGLGLQSASCTYTDMGGLTVSAIVAYSIVDTTPPTLSCNGLPIFRLNQLNAFVSTNVADTGSQPASPVVSVPVSTGTAGMHVVSLTAYDNAGNSSTVNCSYEVTVPATFLLPTQPQPAWNEMKAGGVQPVKFSLGSSDATILAAGYPQSQRVNCTNLTPLGASQPTVATGSGGVAYNGSHFQYQWKTDKTWSGTCRQFILRLDDGTTLRANFRFK